MELTPKPESIKDGEERELLFDQIIKSLGIKSIYTINPYLWVKYQNDKKAIDNLARIGSRRGDRRLRYGKYSCIVDVKTRWISKDSIENFKGQYYVIFYYNDSIDSCIVIEKKNLKYEHVNHDAYEPMPKSGNKGLRYSKLVNVPHITFDEFIKKVKT